MGISKTPAQLFSLECKQPQEQRTVPSQNRWGINDTDSLDDSKANRITSLSVRREVWILNEM